MRGARFRRVLCDDLWLGGAHSPCSSRPARLVVWNTAVESWKRHACALVRRNLSAQEWNLYVGPDKPDEPACRGERGADSRPPRALSPRPSGPHTGRAAQRKKWRTRVELANAIFEYLEIFHNGQRRHSAIGMITPIEYEILHQTPWGT